MYKLIQRAKKAEIPKSPRVTAVSVCGSLHIQHTIFKDVVQTSHDRSLFL